MYWVEPTSDSDSSASSTNGAMSCGDMVSIDMNLSLSTSPLRIEDNSAEINPPYFITSLLRFKSLHHHEELRRLRGRTSASAVEDMDTNGRHVPTLPCPDGFSLRRNRLRRGDFRNRAFRVRNEKHPLPSKQSTQMATLELMEMKVTLRNKMCASTPESAQIGTLKTLKTTSIQLQIRQTTR